MKLVTPKVSRGCSSYPGSKEMCCSLVIQGEEQALAGAVLRMSCVLVSQAESQDLAITSQKERLGTIRGSWLSAILRQSKPWVVCGEKEGTEKEMAY